MPSPLAELIADYRSRAGRNASVEVHALIARVEEAWKAMEVAAQDVLNVLDNEDPNPSVSLRRYVEALRAALRKAGAQ